MKISARLWIFGSILFGFALTPSPSFAAEKSTTAAVRETIAKSLPFIAEKGQWWIEKKKCVSCHRVSFMTWSLSAAKRRGFEVDAQLDEQIEWSLAHQLGPREKGGVVGSGNLEGLSQLITAGHVSPKSDKSVETYEKFLKLIVEAQKPDGTWKPGGQLPAQKRPLPETTAVFTMWIALALQDAPDAKSQAAQKKALTWIQSAKPGASTEWHIVRMLIALERNEKEQLELRKADLIARQNSDGGWGWKKGDPSDALATGQAIYALAKVGNSIEEPLKRGQRFLIETQTSDGSWKVPGTKRSAKNKPVETANYWGTCWAAIGLLETLTQ